MPAQPGLVRDQFLHSQIADLANIQGAFGAADIGELAAPILFWDQKVLVFPLGYRMNKLVEIPVLCVLIRCSSQGGMTREVHPANPARALAGC
jgi:hypothetical protein